MYFFRYLNNGIFLKIALGLVSAEKTDFRNIFITASICALLDWIPCIGCVLCWGVITSRHNTGFGTAIAVWFLAILIALIIAILIGLVIIFLIFGIIIAF